jgi:hypothetical protein
MDFKKASDDRRRKKMKKNHNDFLTDLAESDTKEFKQALLAILKLVREVNHPAVLKYIIKIVKIVYRAGYFNGYKDLIKPSKDHKKLLKNLNLDKKKS